MSPLIAAAAHQFHYDSQVLPRLVEGFTLDDWFAVDAAGHVAAWIVGHLASLRRQHLGSLGETQALMAWERQVGRGTKQTDLPRSCDPAQLLRAFLASGENLSRHWGRLRDDELTVKIGRPMPDGSDTMAGAISFLAWHETYHLGQLGMIRRLRGKPGLA